MGASSELLQALSRAREEREERAGEGRRDDEGKEGERRNWRPVSPSRHVKSTLGSTLGRCWLIESEAPHPAVHTVTNGSKK